MLIRCETVQVAFRVDASIEIGTGHVMRCLTLASALREQGAVCVFVCRPLQGHLIYLIAQRGFEVKQLPEAVSPLVKQLPTQPKYASWLEVDWQTDAQHTNDLLQGQVFDWLVLDHYALDIHWQQAVAACYHRLFVIDDLADREHDCDVLLDQNLGRTPADYQALVPKKAQLLIGPHYALLRPEFAQYREGSLNRRLLKPSLQQILVTLGGVDKNNMTEKILACLNTCQFSEEIQMKVVMGASAPYLSQVKQQAQNMRFKTEVLVGVDNMAQLMSESDLAIGAAGSTSWERCCLGLPTFMFVLAENQLAIAKALNQKGIATLVDLNTLTGEINNLLTVGQTQSKLIQMIEAASQVTQGQGAAFVLKFFSAVHA